MRPRTARQRLTAGRRVVASAIALIACVLPVVFAGGAAAGAWPPECLGKPATIMGTAGGAPVIGTDRDDVFGGFQGDDFIDMRGGDDIVCTGEGHNVVIGGQGNDRIVGGPDGETLIGDEYSASGPASGGASDEIKAGAGADI